MNKVTQNNSQDLRNITGWWK